MLLCGGVRSPADSSFPRGHGENWVCLGVSETFHHELDRSCPRHYGSEEHSFLSSGSRKVLQNGDCDDWQHCFEWYQVLCQGVLVHCYHRCRPIPLFGAVLFAGYDEAFEPKHSPGVHALLLQPHARRLH